MSTKRLIWFGAAVGSTLGGFLPNVWHASMFSMWGLLCSTIGGVLGIWAAWKLAQQL